MAVITISRNYANNGDVIARDVADKLGWPLIDKHLLADVFSEYGMVELKDFLDGSQTLMSRITRDNKQYLEMMEKVMFVLAKRGNAIIVGRGGFEVLKELQNGLHVMVKAPMSERLWFAMERDELSKEEAEKIIKQKDQTKDDFLKQYYGVDDHNVDNFDLVLDASMVTLETASKLLIEAAHHVDEYPKATKLNAEEIECDPILEDAIFKVIRF